MLARIGVGLLIAFGVSWVVLFTVALAFRPRGMPMRELVRIAPDALRLVCALARDPDAPRSVRWRLRVALLYNVQPVNLIPDFIPVIGFADNIAVIVWALRSVVRVSGPAAARHAWRGTPQGLELLLRFAGGQETRDG